jgi:signal peptide peptidase SppA
MKKSPPLNLRLLSRVLSQPWAIRHEELALFTQMILEPASREVTDWDGETRKQTAQAGYLPFNDEAWIAASEGHLPAVPEGVTVLLVWGILGRAWTASDRWWFDPVDVDHLTAAISATPEGSTVVLWIRSPGGVCMGVPEAAEALRALGETRRLLAFTDYDCCSAAYWLAAQCQQIHATPTAFVGSIGVYNAFYDFTEFLAKAGVKLELFKAGRLKAMGLPGNPLSDEARQHIQRGVDEAYRQFTAAVLANREIDSEHMQGQYLVGKAAKSANLYDKEHPSAEAFFKKLKA